ncbi:MAG: hypothetical protein V1900_03800 [Candidatus Aenigmatarchaeota archaeon]
MKKTTVKKAAPKVKEIKLKKQTIEIPDKVEEPQPQGDLKLGEFKLRDTEVLVIKKTNYNGIDRIDFRVWMNSDRYMGPTKKGFVLTMDKIDDFIAMVEGMKAKLAEAKK